MDYPIYAVTTSHALLARAAASNPKTVSRPPVYKAVGIALAITAGVFIGTSFVLKKIGLLKANVKYHEEAGEGYGYLKNAWWWTGMTLMIVGEICNFAAYAFVDAILVTPLGALSVVITTILSAIFLKERLSFVGKVGCFICIVGSVVIVMNAPSQSSAATIQQMQHFVVAPGFLSYAGVVIVFCAFVALWAGPRYGKKSMLVYLTICSLIGGLSVVATQGLGAAIVTQAAGTPQFNQWFLYVLLVFVIATLVTEIIYLNKALNLYNAALVTPTYYVYFTSSTIVTSAILFRGFKGTPSSIITVVMGFLQICSGVVLLQFSKSAKDVPDAAVFTGDLDQVRTVAEQEQPETEPKADAIRGTAALIRRLSGHRQRKEVEEARRLQQDRMRDLEPIREGEQFEWDGIRRRRTMSTRSDTTGSLRRQKTIHPPLGMSHMPPDPEEELERGRSVGSRDGRGDSDHNNMLAFTRYRPWSAWRGRPSNEVTDEGGPSTRGSTRASTRGSTCPVPLTDISAPAFVGNVGRDSTGPGEDQMAHGWMNVSPMQPSPDYAAHISPPASPIRVGSEGQQGGRRGRRVSLRWAAETGNPPSAARSGSNSPPPPRPPPHTAKRQFSFQNLFRPREAQRTPSSLHDGAGDEPRPRSKSGSAGGAAGRQPSYEHRYPSSAVKKSATEEERLGLVQGDSAGKFRAPGYAIDDRDSEDVYGRHDEDEDDDEKEWRRIDARPIIPKSDFGRLSEMRATSDGSGSSGLSTWQDEKPRDFIIVDNRYEHDGPRSHHRPRGLRQDDAHTPPPPSPPGYDRRSQGDSNQIQSTLTPMEDRRGGHVTRDEGEGDRRGGDESQPVQHGRHAPSVSHSSSSETGDEMRRLKSWESRTGNGAFI